MPLSCPGKKEWQSRRPGSHFLPLGKKSCFVFIWRSVLSPNCTAATLSTLRNSFSWRSTAITSTQKNKKKATVYLFNPTTASHISIINSEYTQYIPAISFDPLWYWLMSVHMCEGGTRKHIATNIDCCLLFRRSRLNEAFIGWSSLVTTLNS